MVFSPKGTLKYLENIEILAPIPSINADSFGLG